MPDIAMPQLDIHRHRLANGLEVVLQPDTSLPLIAVNLWYHVGSKNERPTRTGLAHLFEHMLFQGSSNVPVNDHFRLIQQAGGSANGSTWFDRTNYYETLPASHLDLALWLESDRMGFLLPALDQEKLENQRNVVMNERRQRIDNQPYGRAFERLNELLFPSNHPYHWPVIGYMEDIEAATLDDVSDFFRTYYAPNNAVLTLAGDFRAEDALQRVEHYFGSLPEGVPIAPVSAPSLSGWTREHEIMEDAVELSRVYLAASIPAFGDRAWYAADLLATALSAGKSSPLYRDLVHDRQIAMDASAFALPMELTGSFVIVATARPGIEIEVVTEAIEQHLQEMIRNGPSATDLDRARNKVTTALSDQFQKLDDRADLLSMFTTYFDDPERLHHEAQLYADLTREDLVELAFQHLQPEARASLTVVPEGSG